jgi:hypothetical protein
LSNPRPRRPRKKAAKSRLGLWIGLGVGGFLFFAMILVVVAVSAWWFSGPTGIGGGTASLEAWTRIELGMTTAEVEELMGPGTEASQSTVSQTVNAFQSGPQRSGSIPLAVNGADSWMIWRGRDVCVIVGFARPSASGRLVNYICRLAPHGENEQVVGLGQNLEQRRAKRLRDQSELNDPKWAKGKDIRRLIVGNWAMKGGSLLYAFHADGTLSYHAAATPWKTTYRFTDDETIEFPITAYDSRDPNRTVLHTHVSSLYPTTVTRWEVAPCSAGVDLLLSSSSVGFFVAEVIASTGKLDVSRPFSQWPFSPVEVNELGLVPMTR